MLKLNGIFRSKLVTNSLWLYLMQIFNTVIPLLTLPYITRILGSSQYGTFSTALNLIGYFQVIVEYGFNLTGARKIAVAKSEDEISRIYSKIMFCKLLLCSISMSLLGILMLTVNISRVQIMCMVILYMIVIGETIRQTWIFQGMEKMKIITIVSVVSRSISVLLIFGFVRNSDQIFLYCALYAITFLLTGIFSIFIVRFQYNIRFIKVTWREIFEELKDSWYLFTTSAMTKVLTGIGITILGISGTPKDVGIYSAIHKIPYILTLIYAPIGQVLYPFISKKYSSSFTQGFIMLWKLSKYIVVCFIMLGIVMMLFSDTIINILYGEEYVPYSYLMIPLIIWFIFSILNNLLGVQTLVASGHQKEYSKSFVVGVIATITLNISFGLLWNLHGVAIASVLSEVILTVALIFQIRCVLKKKFIN